MTSRLFLEQQSWLSEIVYFLQFSLCKYAFAFCESHVKESILNFLNVISKSSGVNKQFLIYIIVNTAFMLISDWLRNSENSYC